MRTKILILIGTALLFFAVKTMAQVPSNVPTNGLVGWWPFSGNANDLSGNGNNGTVNGATLTTDRFGNINAAYSFVSGNTITISPSLPTGNNPRSFYVWFQTASLSYDPGSGYNANVIFNYGSANTGQMLGLETQQGYLVLNFYAQEIVSSNFVSDSLWHNAIYTYNGTIHKLYLDGNLIDSSSISINTTLTNLVLGTRFSEPNKHNYNGKIDDLGIWNRALTQQEIAQLYQGCNLSITTNPINQNVNTGSNAQFIAASSDTSATYHWQTDLGLGFQNISNAGQYSGANKDTLIVSNTTTANNNQQFRCIVTSGVCLDTSTVATLSVTSSGINNIVSNNKFNVYPNPANSQINVQINASLIGSIYTITDQIGKTVLSGKLTKENSTIELGDLLGGIYLISIGNNTKQTFKVIKK